MKSKAEVGRRVGRAIRAIGERIAMRSGMTGTWIDVGAHEGETTLYAALQNPRLKVYALEPNLTAAARLIGRAPNYFVVPMAVAETDGYATLNVNKFEAASSLLAMDETALGSWIGGKDLGVVSTVTVPAMRLDTFMSLTGIQKVDYLKIDTQGLDLVVVKSAGNRLRDIVKITLEVDVMPVRLYAGAPSKEEIIAFLDGSGFSLARVEPQNHGQEENLTFVRASRKD
jgi:FkbM family methyltransferase